MNVHETNRPNQSQDAGTVTAGAAHSGLQPATVGGWLRHLAFFITYRQGSVPAPRPGPARRAP